MKFIFRKMYSLPFRTGKFFFFELVTISMKQVKNVCYFLTFFYSYVSLNLRKYKHCKYKAPKDKFSEYFILAFLKIDKTYAKKKKWHQT